MDIQKKLKFVFWILILVLWGAFVYGFLKKGKLKEAIKIENPFKDIKLAKILPGPVTVSDADLLPAETTGTTVLPEIPLDRYRISSTDIPVRVLVETSPDMEITVPTAYEKPVSLADYHTVEERREVAEKPSKKDKVVWGDPPEDYAVENIKNFLIYKEIPPILKKLITMLGYLRGNLMLDLVIFSPWERYNKVLIYLFDKKMTYHKFTKRPIWSQGTSDLLNRTIYVVNGSGALGILAHELSHIYFDSFFDKYYPSPLWLSEGVAVFMQVERGKQEPAWLKQTLSDIKESGGFSLEKLMSYSSLNGIETQSVQMWYAQSYSVVRFMMKFKNMDVFYQFCKNLRQGHSISGGLYRSYGAPFNKVSSLEYAWRYDLKTNKITGIE
jgi:hypothetical protein